MIERELLNLKLRRFDVVLEELKNYLSTGTVNINTLS